jgi:hypothetical protein
VVRATGFATAGVVAGEADRFDVVVGGRWFEYFWGIRELGLVVVGGTG